MKKFFAIIISFLVLISSFVFADSNDFVPATYLDTEAKFDISDDWIYEGVLFDENYSQKKYTLMKNLDVSILYGMRNLKEEIQKKMPFVSAESLLNGLTEESLVSILGSASQSTIEEKLYGNNKFYEFSKTQKVTEGLKTIDVNCIVDMMVEGDNIYSFSYIYKNEKDGLVDYGKVLTSFSIKNNLNQEIELNEEKVEEVKELKEDIQPKIIKEEIKEELAIEIDNNSGEIVDNESEITIESGETSFSVQIDSGDILKETSSEIKDEELEFENLGVVQNTYKPKSWIESVFSIIISNPIILIGIIVLVIIEITIFRIIRKKKKESRK